MEFELDTSFLGEVLKSPRMREIVETKAHIGQELAQSEVAKRTGVLAASITARTEIGGIRNDRWVGVVEMGGEGAKGTATYAASYEFGAGNHAAAEAVPPPAGKKYGKGAKPGSTGRHHNRPAHVLDSVIQQLDAL